MRATLQQEHIATIIAAMRYDVFRCAICYAALLAAPYCYDYADTPRAEAPLIDDDTPLAPLYDIFCHDTRYYHAS